MNSPTSDPSAGRPENVGMLMFTSYPTPAASTTAWLGCLEINFPRRCAIIGLHPAPIEDIELEAGIWRKKLSHFLEAFCQCGRGQQWILPLAQILIFNIHVKRQHVDCNGVGKGCRCVFGFGFLIHPAGASTQCLL